MPPESEHLDLFRRKAKPAAVKSGMDLPERWRETLHGEEQEARTLLLSVIAAQPDTLVPVLQEALTARNSEVSHIAAAALMKQHQLHEKRMAAAEAEYRRYPDNMPALARQIDAIDAYRRSGLPDSFAMDELTRR